MLSDKEEQFIVYWETVRENENKPLVKIKNGLPMAVIFCLPVLLFIFSVRIFLPDWYAKISNASSGTIVIIVIAVFLCVLFYAYFRMHYKWEMNEQHYRELQHKAGKTGA